MHTINCCSPAGEAREPTQHRAPLRQRWGIFCPLTPRKQ